MKRLAAALVLSTAIAQAAHAPTASARDGGAPAVPAAVQSATPALAAYMRDSLYGDVWQRPDLSPRDRSLVTLAALVARNQADDMPDEVDRALENGVRAAELSELITHLAFYTGWGNAVSAAEVAAAAFAERGIGTGQLPAADPTLLPLDAEAEARRESFVQERFGDVSPGVVDKTRDLLFLDLWLRPALTPRDRSLVTVSALVATGKVEQMPFHLNKAMDNGLTKPEASEVLTQLAFYAGWPNVFSALPVAKEVFAAREEK
ncbi:carboxymuconolactone decarboxylase family protein [Marinibaculum pumilum]|uniref:Carboxymuconolactone decarboxylase family protein n=1 Tax=Marinibaculum pumilum TaxID=1766165 RepID=A0ABV7L1T0_9PROT